MSSDRALSLVLVVLLAGCATIREKGTRWVPEEAPRASSSQPRKLALVVGVNRFEDPRFTDLRFAERDAEAFAASLEGFSRVVLLTGEQTRRPVELDALSTLLNEARAPEDTVVVYFSAHGSLAQRPGAGLERVVVTRDARMDVLLQTGLAVDELKALLEKSAAKRRLLVLALCHSGKGKSQLSDPLANALRQQKGPPPSLEAVSEATVVLTACAFGETARESDALAHDVYTHFLLEGFRQGDLDQDGAITATEAHDYARGRTYEFTEGQQRPTSESEILGVDPIVLRGARARSGRPVVFSHARSAEGLRVLLEGRDKGALPGSIAVEPGTHEFSVVDGSTSRVLATARRTFEDGERVSLTELLPRPVSVEVGAGVQVVAPLSGPFRQNVVPVLFGAAARVMGRRLGLQWLALEGEVGWGTGAGETPGIGVSLRTRTHQLALLAGLGPTVSLGGWRLDLLATGGLSVFFREVMSTGFVASDGAAAPSVGGRLRVGWSTSWLGVAMTADMRVLPVTVGATSSWQPLLGVAVEVSWSPQR
ncbi:MAG: caspase family protein [Myxococcaceae bacterium]|nr:caspase family protein [Myxococcaceae bacterium]MCA3016845.1 caspase family protein [Myxococcaceae bacterium]